MSEEQNEPPQDTPAEDNAAEDNDEGTAETKLVSGSPKKKVAPEPIKESTSMEENIEIYKDAMEWTTDRVVQYLEEHKFDGQVLEIFRREEIVGSDLPLLDKELLIDMGISVGDRVRLIRCLAEFKALNIIVRQRAVIWNGTEFHFCPCWPIFPMHYVLTNTTLTTRKSRCCGETQNRIDLSDIQDIDLFQECITGTVKIVSPDYSKKVNKGEGAEYEMEVVDMTLGKSESKQAYDTIKNAVETDQQILANARVQKVTAGNVLY